MSNVLLRLDGAVEKEHCFVAWPRSLVGPRHSHRGAAGLYTRSDQPLEPAVSLDLLARSSMHDQACASDADPGMVHYRNDRDSIDASRGALSKIRR
jgi:hypothetical protein